MDKTPQESDIAFIRALAELLRETDLTEIEVNREYGDDDVLTVRVARQITVTAPAPVQVAMPAVSAALSAPATVRGVFVSAAPLRA